MTITSSGTWNGTNSTAFGINCSVTGGTLNVAYRANVTGSGSNNRGVSCIIESTGTDNYGLFSACSGAGTTNYAAYLNATNGTTDYSLYCDNGDIRLGGSGDKIGFFGTAVASRPSAYTPTNVTTDRSFDADLVLITELADVVGTLISDLQSLGLLQ